MKFDNNIDLRKIAILRQKSEFLSHQKVRQNKSPAPALFSATAASLLQLL